MYMYMYICICIQCSKLSFYFVRHPGALVHITCTRQLVHALPSYIDIIIHWKNVHTPGAQLRKTCARRRKCARRAQCAPLISNTVYIYIYLYIYISIYIMHNLSVHIYIYIYIYICIFYIYNWVVYSINIITLGWHTVMISIRCTKCLSR